MAYLRNIMNNMLTTSKLLNGITILIVKLDSRLNTIIAELNAHYVS